MEVLALDERRDTCPESSDAEILQERFPQASSGGRIDDGSDSIFALIGT